MTWPCAWYQKLTALTWIDEMTYVSARWDCKIRYVRKYFTDKKLLTPDIDRHTAQSPYKENSIEGFTRFTRLCTRWSSIIPSPRGATALEATAGSCRGSTMRHSASVDSEMIRITKRQSIVFFWEDVERRHPIAFIPEAFMAISLEDCRHSDTVPPIYLLSKVESTYTKQECYEPEVQHMVTWE